MGAAGLGDGGRAARGRPRDDPRPGRRPAGRGHRRARRPRAPHGRPGHRAARAAQRPTTTSSAPLHMQRPVARTKRVAALLFGPDSPPGASESFDVDRDCAPRGGRSRRPADRRRPARVRARHRDQAPRAAQARRRPAARAARRAAARLPRGPRERARLRGEGGRVHPGDRRAGPAVLGLPRLPPREAREGARARHGRGDHPHADGRRLPAARPLQQVLRRGHGPARAGGARHGGPPRHVRARLHARATTRTWATRAT